MSCHDNMLHLLNLPDGILDKILSCMSYDDIARQRLVCRKFDQTCRNLLNKGFVAVERYHGVCLKNVKAQLPRRESERRMHPMFRHCEILTAVETRLSMLSMTFMRYVDIKLCCFIPGKVIDEIFRVLRHVMTSTTQLRAHELLQELRDISSMAMEHFDEKVVPRLKQHLATAPNRSCHSVSSPSNLSLMPSRVSAMSVDKAKLANDFSKMQSQSKHNKKNVDSLKKTVRRLQLKLKRHSVQLSRQSARLREQAQKLREQDTVIAEMKRHMQEWDLTLSDLKAGRLVTSDSDTMISSENSSGVTSGEGSSNSSSISNLASASTSDNESGTSALKAESKQDATPNTSPKRKRTSSTSELPENSENDEMALRAKRFCRILKFCENKSMKHNET
ncbi:F-box only protein 28 isoform X2 [Frankliniella occidentalis]|uniref:F-box only protein 28 isoform X2 n=1 Tax=Frankliniella occidentalis TaxID=133901 RepID=A0A6J1S1X2_FRAOC|nr:F-box only protein 28 isoform X2 [Frankliniella occidentalis]